jgi:hypothetical protein
MGCVNVPSPLGLRRKSRSGISDRSGRAATAQGVGASTHPRRWDTRGAKKEGAGASVYTRPSINGASELGVSRHLVTAGAAAGAAPAARSRQQYGWSKPKLQSTRVRPSRISPRGAYVVRNGAIPKLPCLKWDLLRGDRGPSHGIAPNVPDVRLSLCDAGHSLQPRCQEPVQPCNRDMRASYAIARIGQEAKTPPNGVSILQSAWRNGCSSVPRSLVRPRQSVVAPGWPTPWPAAS